MQHKVVGREEWLKAHAAFLAKEKAHTRERDELAKQRRELPWTLVEKNYLFEGPDGKKTLGELFEGKSQLIVQHFMLGPGWEEGCEGCSFMADHINGPLVHLKQRDVAFTAVSRGPLSAIEKYKKRMGWSFPWYSCAGTEFNFDFYVSFKEGEKEVFYNYRKEPYSSDELPGMSVFYKDDSGRIFHTYSTYGRGNESVMGIYVLMDMLPKGREEVPFKNHPMEWVRRHDEYGGKESGCCH